MSKTRIGDPFMSAYDYGIAMPKFSVNLLVRDVERSVKFYRDVVGVTVRYADGDFAALQLQGWDFMLHADHTYDHHPFFARLSGSGLRGDGTELRFLGVDPDAIEQRARNAGAGAAVLQPARDYAHGWREVIMVDLDGYVWALGVSIPAAAKQ